MAATILSQQPQAAANGLERVTAMISNFESSVYSEELFAVSESEHDEVMRMIAEESEAMSSYGQWPAALESENFVVVNGGLQHKPEPPSQGRIGCFEL